MKDICVLLPAKDESPVIRQTINSILAAGLSPEDIYLVDDGSSDNTGAMALSYGVNVLRSPVNVGKATSVKTALWYFNLAKEYQYIAMMDADTLVDKDYFTAVRNKFTSPDIAVVCGRPLSWRHNWITAYRCWEYYLTHFIYRGGQSNMGVIMVAPGCAATYRSDVFVQLDWSNDTRVEDMDATIQVHRKKLGAICYEPKAVVYTQDPNTIQDFIKQIRRWHGGTWQVVKKYKMFSGTSKIDWEFKLMMGEGVLFSLLFLAAPLWTVLWPGMVIILVLDVALIVATAAAAAIGDRRIDVLLYSPLFIFLRIIYCSIFLYTFWNVIVQRKQLHGWLKVKRY